MKLLHRTFIKVFFIIVGLVMALGFFNMLNATEKTTSIVESKPAIIKKAPPRSDIPKIIHIPNHEAKNYQKIELVVAAIAAFSTFLAVFWVLLKDTILRWWKRPMFECDLKVESPYITKTNVKYGAQLFTPGYYYHIRVLNNGRSIAKSCVGYIEELYYGDEDGHYHKVNNFIPLPVAWAHEGHIHTHINPKQKKYLDIGFITKQYYKVLDIPEKEIPRLGNEGDIVFRFCFRGFPYGEVSELWAGSYKIKISIYSENTKSFSGYLDLKWSGNWNDNYEEMKKEIQLDFGKTFKSI